MALLRRDLRRMNEWRSRKEKSGNRVSAPLAWQMFCCLGAISILALVPAGSSLWPVARVARIPLACLLLWYLWRFLRVNRPGMDGRVAVHRFTGLPLESLPRSFRALRRIAVSESQARFDHAATWRITRMWDLGRLGVLFACIVILSLTTALCIFPSQVAWPFVGVGALALVPMNLAMRGASRQAPMLLAELSTTLGTPIPSVIEPPLAGAQAYREWCERYGQPAYPYGPPASAGNYPEGEEG